MKKITSRFNTLVLFVAQELDQLFGRFYRVSATKIMMVSHKMWKKAPNCKKKKTHHRMDAGGTIRQILVCKT